MKNGNTFNDKYIRIHFVNCDINLNKIFIVSFKFNYIIQIYVIMQKNEDQSFFLTIFLKYAPLYILIIYILKYKIIIDKKNKSIDIDSICICICNVVFLQLVIQWLNNKHYLF